MIMAPLGAFYLGDFMKKIVLFLLDILVPRFIEERVAVVDGGQGRYSVLCSESDLRDDDHYDFIAKSRCFTWLGMGFFATIEIDEDVADGGD